MVAIKQEEIKEPKHKILKRILLLLVCITATAVLSISLYISMNLSSLPKVNQQALNVFEPTSITDINGNIIWQPTDKHISKITKDEIPETYEKTLLAVEDKDFWTNKGYSNKGIANMIYTTIASKINPSIDARGGSTLEQQLIKNVYFNGGYDIKTTTRKIQEIYLARQLNHNFTKDEILEHYVNNLSFAEGDTGIKSVMKTYFGKQPSDYKDKTPENISEIAYMAGLGQNPTTYNLYENPEKAKERISTVLSVMLENNIINNNEYESAKAYDITKSLKPRYWEADEQRNLNLKYKVYTDKVLSDVAEMGYNIDDVSLTIKTYLNPETFDNITNTVRNDKYYQDSFDTPNAEQVGAAIIDKDGIVQGLVGSRYENDEVNRALQKTRSSGSSMKPFTAYGPLLQYLGNQYNTASTFSSSPYLYPGTNFYMNNWGNYTYGNVDIQRALRMSLNTVVARIDDEVLGSNRMKDFLHGVQLDNNETYSAIDGIGLYISPLDAAAAYNTINNGGIYVKPRLIQSIKFTDGSTKEIKPESKRVMNASTAYVLTQMLRGTLQTGFTASSAMVTTNDYSGYAAKTGTVGLDPTSPAPNVYGDGGSDSWFDSMTNQGYSIALWFGYDKPNESPQVADIFDGPQHLGRDLQLQLNGNKSIPNWEKPENVTVISGSGINTHYAITDSKDINNNDTLIVPEITSQYPLIGKLKPQTQPYNNNWESSMTDNDKQIYELYKNNTLDVTNATIIDDKTYNLLRGE